METFALMIAGLALFVSFANMYFLFRIMRIIDDRYRGS